MSSTLIETVSINYEDFSESFLTCGTCLCIYNNDERTPKLLCCSHTVCFSCLQHIIEAQGQGSTNFRCPICRENITIPRGGVAAFPPSFIVNQLLDLMVRQRRDIIPRCAQHSQTELMFCETCDEVFCLDCAESTHGSTGASAHTIVPFSVAIKRMSEILLYKAGLCVRNLNEATEKVTEEMRRLDEESKKCIDESVTAFQRLSNLVEKRMQDVVRMTLKITDDKKKCLKEQLIIIEGEKRKVEAGCRNLQNYIEVQSISSKIGDLNEMLDASTMLMEPRENSYLSFRTGDEALHTDFTNFLEKFGSIAISRTYPALCSAYINSNNKTISAHLWYTVSVVTVDYYGNHRVTGGDPIDCKFIDSKGSILETQVTDDQDGTYQIKFKPDFADIYKLHIRIFNREIRDSPLIFSVTEHINPVIKQGSTGSELQNFRQPVTAVIAADKLFVLDTGNSRIKVLDSGSLKVEKVFTECGLDQNSATGLTIQSNNLAIVNWRTKYVTFFTFDGHFVRQFTSEKFIEPIALAANCHNETFVVDNGVGAILVFDGTGNFFLNIGERGQGEGQFGQMTAVCCTPFDQIIVCDSRLQIFSRTGAFLFDIKSESERGTFGGVCMDGEGRILACRSEKGRSFIQIYGADRKWLFNIDSFDDRLKRPSGIVVSPDGFVNVVDLGNDCVKKFRYL